jgi:peroxiredoxin
VKLEENKDFFDDLGVQIIPISVSNQSGGIKAKEKSKSSFNFHSDPNSSFSNHLGLLHKSGHPFKGTDIAQIGKVLVDSNGLILWTHFTSSSRVRLTTKKLIEELEKNISS